MTTEAPPTKTVRRKRRGPIELEGLKQCCMMWFYVADLGRSLRFYRDQVGLKLTFTDEETGWATFATGADGVELALCVWPHGGTLPRGGGACPVFEVVDLEKARLALEERGVEFDGEIVGAQGSRRHSTFHDPDGNPIQLTQVW